MEKINQQATIREVPLAKDGSTEKFQAGEFKIALSPEAAQNFQLLTVTTPDQKQVSLLVSPLNEQEKARVINATNRAIQSKQTLDASLLLAELTTDITQQDQERVEKPQTESCQIIVVDYSSTNPVRLLRRGVNMVNQLQTRQNGALASYASLLLADKSVGPDMKKRTSYVWSEQTGAGPEVTTEIFIKGDASLVPALTGGTSQITDIAYESNPLLTPVDVSLDKPAPAADKHFLMEKIIRRDHAGKPIPVDEIVDTIHKKIKDPKTGVASPIIVIKKEK
ncbi:hypothetical protein KKG65_00045 [Patescibacteria group bacterium]|nr:hypothetical protein [Patescibacteria group bacterium]